MQINAVITITSPTDGAQLDVPVQVDVVLNDPTDDNHIPVEIGVGAGGDVTVSGGIKGQP